MAKKKHFSVLIRFFLVTGSVALLFIAIVAGWHIFKGEPADSVLSLKPKAFGTTVPGGYVIFGIDVSRHQENINWLKVRNMISNGKKIGFVFIKATEGITRKDDHFEKNWKDAGKAGFVRGAYHYFHPTRHPERQAANFIRHVKLSKGDLPPVVDVEIRSGKSGRELVKLLKEYVEMIEMEYKTRPIIYTNLHFYNQWLKDDFGDYPLWISCYFDQQRFEDSFQSAWCFWQYSESGSIEGIKGRVDLNVFRGSQNQFQALCIK